MSKNTTNRRVGNWGEDRAAEHLEKSGYEIVDRNFRAERGEIDIIAKKDSTLVFIEVKTSRSDRLGPPEIRVDKRKQAQIGKIAAAWLIQHEIEDTDCRFDVIGIVKRGSEIKIKHYTDAFWL